MKQIFDWLREQIAKLQEIDLFTTRYINRDKVFRLINKAEAKWESDCCEWHRIESSEFDYMDSKHGFLEEYTTGWNFCPYCGKRIKILEVE